ncbi:uncharacterized protein LOC113569021 [Electrophorus electricus]|uniref:uncharacterized protein LOC113569021 n=1 Tax=Electrophorus electricus TaxID=8005 RepID=UPI0015CFCC4D|nr:uncharacterized protein LOC113569021 [Electrophorus electricus]
MKMSLVICFALSVGILSNELHVLGPSGPLAIQPGGSVMLLCYVQTPIPVEELEVEWRRTDSETVVHLFQDGKSQPESQDQAYRDRANFFTEEISHGNFSLLLKDVTTKDTGVYKCVVYKNQEYNETLIEVKISGYSAIHKLELFLCAFVCLCGISLLLACIPWTCIKLDDNHMIKIQHALVFCPNIVMFLAFIIWGQLDGFFSEIAVCSAINLLRIAQLLNFTPFIANFEGKVQQRIKISTSLECPVLYIVVYSVLRSFWRLEYEIAMIAIGIITLSLFIGYVFFTLLQEKLPDALFRDFLRLFDIGLGVLFSICFLSFFLIYYWKRNDKDFMGLIFDIVLLFIVTVLAFAELGITGRQKPLRKQPLVPFSRLCMCGVAVLFLVNSLTLTAELILSMRNGKRTIEDLQVILLPFEWVFALGCIIAMAVVEYTGKNDYQQAEANELQQSSSSATQ